MEGFPRDVPVDDIEARVPVAMPHTGGQLSETIQQLAALLSSRGETEAAAVCSDLHVLVERCDSYGPDVKLMGGKELEAPLFYVSISPSQRDLLADAVRQAANGQEATDPELAERARRVFRLLVVPLTDADATVMARLGHRGISTRWRCGEELHDELLAKERRHQPVLRHRLADGERRIYQEVAERTKAI